MSVYRAVITIIYLFIARYSFLHFAQLLRFHNKHIFKIMYRMYSIMLSFSLLSGSVVPLQKCKIKRNIFADRLDRPMPFNAKKLCSLNIGKCFAKTLKICSWVMEMKYLFSVVFCPYALAGFYFYWRQFDLSCASWLTDWL